MRNYKESERKANFFRISDITIMVDKIPENAEVTAGLGLSDYNWKWSE